MVENFGYYLSHILGQASIHLSIHQKPVHGSSAGPYYSGLGGYLGHHLWACSLRVFQKVGLFESSSLGYSLFQLFYYRLVYYLW